FVDGGVGLAQSYPAGLDHDVEEVGHHGHQSLPLGWARRVSEDEVVGEEAGLEPLMAAADGLDHLGTDLPRQLSQYRSAVDLVPGGAGLGLEQLGERGRVDLAALQPRPGVRVGVGGVEPPQEPRWQPVVLFVPRERLEGARDDHPAEVEDDGTHWHSSASHPTSRSRATASHSSVDRRSDSTSTRSSSPWNMRPNSAKGSFPLNNPTP